MILSTIKAATVTNPALLPWVEGFQRLWPLIWRVALALFIFWLGWHYGGKEAEMDLAEFKTAHATATAAAVAQLQKEVADRDAQLATQEREANETITDLRIQQATRPAPSVRVCKPAASVGAMPRVSASAGIDPHRPAGSGELSDGMGVDIGPAVQRLVNRAELVRVKCLAQQDRADRLTTMKPQTIPVHP